MSGKATTLFILAGLLILALIIASVFTPPTLIIGLPALLWLWIIGLIAFNLILFAGVKAHGD